MVALNLILHLLWAYRASASWAPGARSIFFFPFSALFHFFMPFHYSFYYPILSISPLTTSFLFLTYFFFLIFIFSCLLKLSSLLGWSLRCLKIKNVLAGQVPQSHSLTRGMSCSLFLSSCSPLVSSSHFPGSSMWSHCSIFHWLQLPWPTVSILIFFFFFSSTPLPSSTPNPQHFHIATDHKGTTGLLI